jgi:hypothetical protein
VKPGGGPLLLQLLVHVFVVGIAGRPAGAVNEIEPDAVPAVALVKTFETSADKAQPPTAGELIVVKPTILCEAIVPDVVPDELHDAVANAAVDVDDAPDVAGATGVDEPPPHAAKPALHARTSAAKAPTRQFDLCMLGVSPLPNVGQ